MPKKSGAQTERCFFKKRYTPLFIRGVAIFLTALLRTVNPRAVSSGLIRAIQSLDNSRISKYFS